MSSSSPWDAYSQHPGFPPSLEQYAHFSSDMRSLAGGPATGLSGLPGDSMLGYPKTGDLAALASPYAAYGQAYPGMSELGFPGASLRPSSTAHSPGSAPDNLPASSPHGQYSSTPTSENQSSSPSFPNSSLYTPSTVASSISSSPYAQAFGGSAGSADPSARGPFSPFAQSYGYPMYGYNQVAGFPSSNSLEGVNRYMGGISSSQLMQSSAMGLYPNSQASQMAFPYSSMGWGHTIPGFPLKENSDLMSQDELDRYRYRQLSNSYFPGLQAGGSPVRNFPPHALQPAMIRTPPFLDERSHSPPPKKPKKSTEEAERPPTPAPKDPASFHSHRGIYLFTSNVEPGSPNYFCDKYVLLEKELCEKLSRVSLPGKIQYVYNPLEYAFDSHMNFVRRFCTGEKYVLFVGMNPGPFGMSQNGVPFGECAIVKEWLQIEGEVLKPVLEHPKRRVVGLECSRSEVTGGRFWQLFRTLCHTPEHFFRTSYVHNLCPFAFLTDSGKNVTPPQLTSSVLDQINLFCNATLVEVVRLLKSKYVICIGKYALAQAQKALSADEFSGITLECLMHPSPINPAANKGWADIAIKQLTEIGIIDVIRYGRVPYQAPSHSPSLSQQSHLSSSSSLSQHSHSQHSYQNKQSPSHYGFQSPPVQSYQQSTSQGSNSHQSPVHASQLNRSPGQVSSPPRTSSRSQTSPVHSSGSHSPPQGQTNKLPDHTTASANFHSGLGDQPQDVENIKKETINSDQICSENSSTLDPSVAISDSSHNEREVTQQTTNSIPAYSRSPDEHENGTQNSNSDTGSQGSDASKGNSPNAQYPPGNQQEHLTGSQLSARNAQMALLNSHVSSGISMNADNQQMHLPMNSSHFGMGMPMGGSPGLQQGGASDQGHSLSNEGVGSPHMKAMNPHMSAHNSQMDSNNSHLGFSGHMHMGSQMGGGIHPMGMHGHMSSLNPYGQMEMGQIGGYGSGMPLNYSSTSGMRSGLDMSSYGHHMSLPNPGIGMASMHSARHLGSHMGMFNHHMGSMMGAPEHLSMHPGMNSMYDSELGKEAPYSSHYLDKPPECN